MSKKVSTDLANVKFDGLYACPADAKPSDCPDTTPVDKISYGYNCSLGDNDGYANTSAANQYKYKPRKLHELTQPTETPTMADHELDNDATSSTITKYMKLPFPGYAARDRLGWLHSQRANVAYLDGHVGNVSESESRSWSDNMWRFNTSGTFILK